VTHPGDNSSVSERPKRGRLLTVRLWGSASGKLPF